MAREQMEPHVIRTIVTDNGTTVHLCDNFLQDVAPGGVGAAPQ